MPMPAYPVRCTAPGCNRLAVYKIAGRWSDGVTGELKTYALSCPDCLAALYERSLARHKKCRLAPAETLEAPGIYQLARGQRDRELTRRPEFEISSS